MVQFYSVFIYVSAVMNVDITYVNTFVTFVTVKMVILSSVITDSTFVTVKVVINKSDSTSVTFFTMVNLFVFIIVMIFACVTIVPREKYSTF